MDQQQVCIHEVGLRDGLQMETQLVPLQTKLHWARLLAASGVGILQAGSFVHPQRVPQMADTDELCRLLAREMPHGVTLSALVLNEKGVERALQADVQLLCMGVSASETHSLKNTRMSVAEALQRTLGMAQTALAAGCSVQVSIQSAFGCGFEGAVPAERVLHLAAAYLEAGLRHLSLADTAGHATPRQVEELVTAVMRMDPQIELTCHLHNTYGAGIANCLAALDAGVRCFETAFGGLGGCPFTRVAGGNVCTEDLVHLLQRMGLLADFRLDPVLEVTREAVHVLGKELPGCLYRTGPIRVGLGGGSPEEFAGSGR
jgi:hydroxymethylglutaryl-CoA lyase